VTADDIIRKARKTDLEGEIDWFTSLLDCLEDGEIEDAIKAVQGAIKIKKAELNKLYD